MRKYGYIKWEYGVHPCSNDRCRHCTYYSWNTVSCDYYLRTGEHKQGCGESCTAFRDARYVSARRYRQMKYMERIKS